MLYKLFTNQFEIKNKESVERRNGKRPINNLAFFNIKKLKLKQDACFSNPPDGQRRDLKLPRDGASMCAHWPDATTVERSLCRVTERIPLGG